MLEGGAVLTATGPGSWTHRRGLSQARGAARSGQVSPGAPRTWGGAGRGHRHDVRRRRVGRRAVGAALGVRRRVRGHDERLLRLRGRAEERGGLSGGSRTPPGPAMRRRAPRTRRTQGARRPGYETKGRRRRAAWRRTSASCTRRGRRPGKGRRAQRLVQAARAAVPVKGRGARRGASVLWRSAFGGSPCARAARAPDA